MSKPVKQLGYEHHFIMCVVNALGRISNELMHGKGVDQATLEKIVKFMREYADKFHHAKEEEVLFPEMTRHGVPETGCPLGALRLEHVQGRKFVGALDEAVQAHGRGDDDASDQLIAAITDIGHLYPGHIWKEDLMVFPMVDRLFSEDDLNKLGEQFEKAESILDPEVREEYERFAESLA